MSRPEFDIRVTRSRTFERGPGAWSPRRIFEALSRRFTKLAGDGNDPERVQVGPFSIVRGRAGNRSQRTVKRPSAAPAMNGSELERKAAARAAESERWRTVLSSDEAKDRIPLACSLLGTTMSPEDIRKTLSGWPAEPARGGPSLYERMAALPRPDVGSGGGASAAAAAAMMERNTPRAKAAELLAAYRKALGDNVQP